MRLSYFRLVARPFPTTPDPQFYYAATTHESALERLRGALDDGEGLALLIGEPGTGKSLVARMLLERTGPEVNSALVTNCRFSNTGDLLRAVLFDLGQPYRGLAEQELRLALTEYLIDQFAQGRQTVLVFDEAQDLAPDLLNEIRLLGNIESGRGKAVQSILVAHPSIARTIQAPDLAVFGQRLAVMAQLDPLDEHESADYLLHQLRQAGATAERVLTDEAVSLIAKNARGLPRLLNRYAFHSLSLAERVGSPQVDVEVAMEALGELGIEVEPAEEEFPTRPTLAADEQFHHYGSSAGAPVGLTPTHSPSSRTPTPLAAPWIAGAFSPAPSS